MSVYTDTPLMEGAFIMNMASVTGFLPGPFMSVYFATKHYVLAFSEGLQEALYGGYSIDYYFLLCTNALTRALIC
jgi:short-subunit dehydrogenase